MLSDDGSKDAIGCALCAERRRHDDFYMVLFDSVELPKCKTWNTTESEAHTLSCTLHTRSCITGTTGLDITTVFTDHLAVLSALDNWPPLKMGLVASAGLRLNEYRER